MVSHKMKFWRRFVYVMVGRIITKFHLICLINSVLYSLHFVSLFYPLLKKLQYSSASIVNIRQKNNDPKKEKIPFTGNARAQGQG